MDDWTQIIHNDCGLPIEFCGCPNAEIKLSDEDAFIKEEDEDEF